MHRPPLPPRHPLPPKTGEKDVARSSLTAGAGKAVLHAVAVALDVGLGELLRVDGCDRDVAVERAEAVRGAAKVVVVSADADEVADRHVAADLHAVHR